MDLMDLLPVIYEENTTMEALQSILTGDISTLIENTQRAVNECFINSSSDALSRYEGIFGIQTDVSLSDTFRREILKARVQGIGTVTKQLIIDTAASYSNGTVEIIENPANYSFTVKFTGTLGIPPNMTGLTDTINQIKPAHLAFAYQYTYRTHAMLVGYTHAQLAAYTHETIRGGTM